MVESFFKKKKFIRLLLAKEKGLSWVIEYKPPAACLGRKDNTSVFLEKKCFASIFTSSRGEKTVSLSERSYINYRQRIREKVE